ncbi:MAG: type I pullulanase, partial [Alkalibacterium sp.]
MTPEHPIEERIPYLEDHEYTGDDLGLTYSPETSQFKVWSPLAQKAYVNIYDSTDSPEPEFKYEMKSENNCWTLTISEDLKGYFYTYSF